MKLKRKQKVSLFSMIATFLMVFSLVTPAFAGSESNESFHRSAKDTKLNAQEKVSDRLMGDFDKEEQVTFLVKFTDKADVKKVAEEASDQASLSNLSGQKAQSLKRSAILSELKATSFESQKNVANYLDEQMEVGKVIDYHSYNIVNGMSVTSTKEVAEKIATFEEVDKLLKNETRELHTTTKTDEKALQSDSENIEWNVERIDAPEAWAMGIDGTGTVVASLDSGVQWDHPALKEKYRGYDASEGVVDHHHSFFDAVTDLSEPYDDNGHGTHVTGTMVGSEEGDYNQVGVAPGAKWIAVKVFDAAGNSSDATLLAGAEWLLSPGGRVDLAPDVVNNSWGGGKGLDEWYLEVVENWRAYDIFPEFSAGNTTPSNPGGPGSIAVPANYPVSFATGATDDNDMIADFSLRGPSPYDEVKPDISAPGVNIRSAVPGGGYEGGWNGTSMAGPAVAAVAAMLRQVDSTISVDQMEAILTDTATARTDDEYTDVPNDGYGHGIVNAYNAVTSTLDDLGVVEGQVTIEGEDNEAPTFEHSPVTKTYAGMDLDFLIEAQDNVSISTVELHYKIDGGETQVTDASRISGDYTDGKYRVQMQGKNIEGDSLTYKWVINDFGNNEVISDVYEIVIDSGITPEYEENFEEEPVGWSSSGANDMWEWGVPYSGPDSAYSGENVYATHLGGPYSNNTNATLLMPPVELPDDDSLFLEFTHWHEFETHASNDDWDYGQVVISTDLEEWTEIKRIRNDFYDGEINDWRHDEIDLTDYAGQRVFIGFRVITDGLVIKDGWYLDQVALYDSSRYDSDEEAPTFDHTPAEVTFVDSDLELTIAAEDNTRIKTVDLDYVDENNDWTTVEAELEFGNHGSGTFSASIPEEALVGETITYRWTVEDYGENSVVSDDHVVQIEDHVTVGYFKDFQTVDGWYSLGENDSWELGAPTSGPDGANQGENVYATNLNSHYYSNMDATLMMPPVEVPENGNTLLEFTHWYSFEGDYEDGRSFDFGHVVVSTDREEWTQLETFTGDSNRWMEGQVDLSDYAGERVYVGFNATSDDGYMFNREGWYLDQISLTDNLPAAEEEGKSARIDLGILDNQLGNMLREPTLVDSKDQELNEVEEQTVETTSNQPTSKKGLSDTEEPTLTALPLGATLNVLESGQTVRTNPADGSYSIYHATGAYTIEASAYGYESEQQSVMIENEETVTANFTLDELTQGEIAGTVTDENSGEAIADAKVLLMEDASVQPVETDEDGNFTITAYEGTYTLKVMAGNYHSAEVEVTVEEGTHDISVELEPYYSYPGGEIGYDDGVADNASSFFDAGNGWAVKMSLPEGKDSAVVTDGVFKFWNYDFPLPGGVEFQVEVWDATGSDGMPGEKLAGPVDAEAIRDKSEWTVVDLSEHNIMVEGDFYMVYKQTNIGDNSPGLATDETSPNAERSYRLVSNAWSHTPEDEGNYMIRARVDYVVEAPAITSPTEDGITNDENITIAGTASPTTTAQLMNNGEEVDTAEVDDDGQFNFSTTLTEGDNEFTVVSLVDGSSVGESEAVSIELDTIAPELTIDNPKQGDKTNRETVTVEGTVSDENLDYLEINGQKADMDGDNYSKRILLDNGDNVIEVTAVDLAGNITTKTVTIDVKYDAPEISNLSPEEDVNLKTGKSVKIEFDSEPGLRATFVVHMPLAGLNGGLALNSNPTELPMMEMTDGTYVGYWIIPNNAYADGAKIEVKARDSYENVASEIAEGKLFINLEE